MLKKSILTPYIGVRYNLKEYARRGPHNSRELFSLWHSCLRNVIERKFDVLKKCFPIIASGTELYYALETITDIILAYCIFHNFLRGFDNDESLIDEVDWELEEHLDETINGQVDHDDDYKVGCNIWDDISNEMWFDY